MTALAIDDLNISSEMNSAALTEVVGGGNHFTSFRYGAVQTGNWGRWVYRGYQVLGNAWLHGNLHQVRKYNWKRARVQTQSAWRYGYID